MKSISTKQYFFVLNITYYMQAFAVLFFSFVVWFLVSQGGTPLNNDKMWLIAVPVALLSGITAGYILFKKKMNAIEKNFPLKTKMSAYSSALIIRSALFELPGLFSAIAAYLSGQLMHLAGSMIVFMIFMLLRPTKDNIAMDLQLSPAEKSILEKEDGVIS